MRLQFQCKPVKHLYQRHYYTVSCCLLLIFSDGADRFRQPLTIPSKPGLWHHPLSRGRSLSLYTSQMIWVGSALSTSFSWDVHRIQSGFRQELLPEASTSKGCEITHTSILLFMNALHWTQQSGSFVQGRAVHTRLPVLAGQHRGLWAQENHR